MNVPNKSEIIDLLNKHKGTAYVWRSLRNKYGPPENTNGSFVKDVISAHKASTNASIRKNINANLRASPNAHSNAYGNASSPISGSKTASETGHSEGSMPMGIAKGPDAIIPPPQTNAINQQWNQPRIIYVPVPPLQLDIVAEIEKTIDEVWMMHLNFAKLALKAKMYRRLLEDFSQLRDLRLQTLTSAVGRL